MVNKHYDVLMFEGLTECQEKGMNKELDHKLGTWSFHQIISLVEHKADALEKKMMIIDTCYTSQTCPGHGPERLEEHRHLLYAS